MIDSALSTMNDDCDCCNCDNVAKGKILVAFSALDDISDGSSAGVAGNTTIALTMKDVFMFSIIKMMSTT